MNMIVARFVDGRVLKGTTIDFSPEKDRFHLTLPTSTTDTFPTSIQTEELKAVFFVKDFDGDSQHVEKKVFDAPPPLGARRIGARFHDGEVLVGTTTSYRPGVPGFFLVPADAESNNERCYVVATATREVYPF
jgi:hypothetical protein